MRTAKRKKAGKPTSHEARPHELLKLLQDALRRKHSVKIEFFAGAHPPQREV